MLTFFPTGTVDYNAHIGTQKYLKLSQIVCFKKVIMLGQEKIVSHNETANIKAYNSLLLGMVQFIGVCVSKMLKVTLKQVEVSHMDYASLVLYTIYPKSYTNMNADQAQRI